MLIQRCDKVVTVKRKQEGTRGSLGSVKPTTVDVATGVKCMIQPRSGNMCRGETGNETIGTHLMLLPTPATFDLLQGDSIIYGASSYDVMFVGKYSSHWQIDLSEAVR